MARHPRLADLGRCLQGTDNQVASIAFTVLEGPLQARENILPQQYSTIETIMDTPISALSSHTELRYRPFDAIMPNCTAARFCICTPRPLDAKAVEPGHASAPDT